MKRVTHLSTESARPCSWRTRHKSSTDQSFGCPDGAGRSLKEVSHCCNSWVAISWRSSRTPSISRVKSLGPSSKASLPPPVSQEEEVEEVEEEPAKAWRRGESCWRTAARSWQDVMRCGLVLALIRCHGSCQPLSVSRFVSAGSCQPLRSNHRGTTNEQDPAKARPASCLEARKVGWNSAVGVNQVTIWQVAAIRGNSLAIKATA